MVCYLVLIKLLVSAWRGERGSLEGGIDGIVPIDQLVEPLKGNNCPSLVGKPKLFFIQV